MCFIYILNVYNSCVKEACWIFLFSISKINVISLRCHNKDTLWIFWWMLRNFLLSGTTLFSIWFWITIDLCMKYQFPNSWLFDVLNLYKKSNLFPEFQKLFLFIYLFIFLVKWISFRILLAILFGRKSVFNSKHWDYKKKYFNLFIWLSCDKLVSCNLYSPEKWLHNWIATGPNKSKKLTRLTSPAHSIHGKVRIKPLEI